MKKLLLITAILGMLNIANAYDSIDEALRNGTSKGDVSLFGNYVFYNTPTKDDNANRNYLIGSLGLEYKSGYFKMVRFAASFRAAKPFVNGNDGFWGGDISSPNNAVTAKHASDFSYRTNSAMMGESFIEYFDGDTNIKAGRVSVKNEWANREIDGIHLRNKSFKYTMLEAIWVKNHGYAQYYKMAGMYNVNPFSSFGALHTSAKFNFIDVASAKVFAIFTPSVFNAVGLSAEAKYNGTSIIGIRGNATMSIESSNGLNNGNNGDGSHVGVEGFLGYEKMINLGVGYMQNGRNVGLGSLNTLGNSVVPFLIWGGRPYMEGRNASMAFARLNAQIDVILLGITYGSTSFYNNDLASLVPDKSKKRQNELDVVLEFAFTGHVKGILSVINTHGGDYVNYRKGTKGYLGIQMTF